MKPCHCNNMPKGKIVPSLYERTFPFVKQLDKRVLDGDKPHRIVKIIPTFRHTSAYFVIY